MGFNDVVNYAPVELARCLRLSSTQVPWDLLSG